MNPFNNPVETPVGLDYSSQLNATLHQTFQNGSEISTPCFLDVTQTPMLASDLTPVEEVQFAGPEQDRWITINADKSQTQYRNYQVVGQTMEVEE